MSRVWTALALGWRVALRSTGHGRLRSLALVLSSMVGTVLVLSTLMLARAARVSTKASMDPTFTDDSGPVLLAGAVVAVLLPVAVLSASVARLSAALREQRQSRLHLLGLTPAQVRWVGLGEVGVLALCGWLCGVVAVWLSRPVLAGAEFGGHRYTVAQLGPGGWEVLISAVVAPVLIAVVSLAGGTRGRLALATARGAGTSRPGIWRPLVIGAGLVLLVMGRAQPAPTDAAPGHRDTLILSGIALLALGTVLVLPVVVRFLATYLIARGDPVATIAGRRLQAQPGTQTRVLSSLLIALFLATAAQGLVVAFQDVPQYKVARFHATTESSTAVQVPAGTTDEQVRDQALAVSGVRNAVTTRTVATSCDLADPFLCEHNYVIVASCADLQQIAPGTAGCQDDRAAWIGPAYDLAPSEPLLLHLRAHDQDGLASGATLTTVSLDPSSSITVPEMLRDRFNGWMFVPTDLPGVQEAAAEHGTAQVHVTADPQRTLFTTLVAAGLQPTSMWDMNEMDRIQRTTDGVRLIGVVALLLGLLSCTIGALDRAAERRREVVRLQLLGVPARTLLRAHWLEVALPLLLGTTLALSLGWLSADSYLTLVNPALDIPADFIRPMVFAAVLGGALVAGATSLAANPRIRPEYIRAA